MYMFRNALELENGPTYDTQAPKHDALPVRVAKDALKNPPKIICGSFAANLNLPSSGLKIPDDGLANKYKDLCVYVGFGIFRMCPNWWSQTLDTIRKVTIENFDAMEDGTCCETKSDSIRQSVVIEGTCFDIEETGIIDSVTEQDCDYGGMLSYLQESFCISQWIKLVRGDKCILLWYKRLDFFAYYPSEYETEQQPVGVSSEIRYAALFQFKSIEDLSTFVLKSIEEGPSSTVSVSGIRLKRLTSLVPAVCERSIRGNLKISSTVPLTSFVEQHICLYAIAYSKMIGATKWSSSTVEQFTQSAIQQCSKRVKYTKFTTSITIGSQKVNIKMLSKILKGSTASDIRHNFEIWFAATGACLFRVSDQVYGIWKDASSICLIDLYGLGISEENQQSTAKKCIYTHFHSSIESLFERLLHAGNLSGGVNIFEVYPLKVDELRDLDMNTYHNTNAVELQPTLKAQQIDAQLQPLEFLLSDLHVSSSHVNSKRKKSEIQAIFKKSRKKRNAGIVKTTLSGVIETILYKIKCDCSRMEPVCQANVTSSPSSTSRLPVS